VMYYGSTEQVIEGVCYCLENGGKRLFSAAGCEIPDGTPRANLLAQHQVLTSFFNQQEN
jgi:uroporphyrinogen-III decarboxylase